jgi:hypothetical protein
MVEGVEMIMNKKFVMGMKGQPNRRDETWGLNKASIDLIMETWWNLGIGIYKHNNFQGCELFWKE